MIKLCFASTLLALAACGPSQQPGGGSSVNTAEAHPAGGRTTALTDADRARFDVEGVRLGMSYADVRAAWHKAHPAYRITETTGWIEGLGTYVESLRIAAPDGEDALTATFTSSASGNRAYYLSHTLQDMAVGKPIDRKVSSALVMRKFGSTALIDGPNIYGGDVVGNDGHLQDGCADFKFPDGSTLNKPDASHEKCGLTALASITGDNETTADAVELQVTDFHLLAKLAKDEADGLQRQREIVGRSKEWVTAKPTAL